jgi:hypothetical protein
MEVQMTQSVPKKMFGQWLETKMGEGQIRQTDLAKSAKLDEAMVSRAIHGIQCSYQTAKKLIKALGYEPSPVLAELSEAEAVSPEADLGSLCKALQIIGGYPSTEAALKAAIRREVLAQEAVKV